MKRPMLTMSATAFAIWALILWAVGSGHSDAAVIWVKQPGQFEQCKSVTGSVKYHCITGTGCKADSLKCVPPEPAPPIPPVTGLKCYPDMPNMPCIDLATIPKPRIGSSTLDIENVGMSGVYAPTPNQPDSGAFRLWTMRSHFNFDDAILYQNQPGKSHLHVYFGNTTANAYSTTESLLKGNSTSAGGIANRSAYWVPAMVNRKTGKVQDPEHQLLYYKHSTVTNFKNGLRMISGYMTRSASVANSWERHQWFECNEVYNNHQDNIPACNGRLTMTVAFPDCTNGQIDSADHRSHVTYSENGVCPATHPNKIPTIWTITHYLTNGENTADWALSSDMYPKNGLNSGYSAHGDVFVAWDEAVESTWVTKCINAKLDCHSDLLGDGRRLIRVNQ